MMVKFFRPASREDNHICCTGSSSVAADDGRARVSRSARAQGWNDCEQRLDSPAQVLKVEYHYAPGNN